MRTSWGMMWPVFYRLLTAEQAYSLLCAFNGVRNDHRGHAKFELLAALRAGGGQIGALEGEDPHRLWLLTGQAAEDEYAFHDAAEAIEKLDERVCERLLGWVHGVIDAAEHLEPPGGGGDGGGGGRGPKPKTGRRRKVGVPG